MFKEYASVNKAEDRFYNKWLNPLFFEALNSPTGNKMVQKPEDMSESTYKSMIKAPYLNGELFKKKKDYDLKEIFPPCPQSS